MYGATLGKIVEIIQDAFVLFGGEHLVVGDLDTASDRDEHKNVKGICAKCFGQVEQGVELIDIVTGNCAIELDADALLLQMLDALNGLVERARNLAKCVMRFSIRAINADGDAADAGILNLANHSPGNQCAVGGQCSGQPALSGILSKQKNIRPHERFSTTQHEYGFGELSYGAN